MRKNKFLNTNNNLIIFICMSILLIVIMFQNGNITNMNINEIITFNIIAGMCIIRVSFFQRYKYSLDSFHYLFIYLFCVLAPIVQIGNGMFPWGLYVSRQPIGNANILIILWLILYMISYEIILRRHSNRSKNRVNKKLIINDKKANIIIVFIAILATMIIVKEYGFKNLFSRSTSSLMFQEKMKSTALIIGVFFRCIPVACLALLIFKMKYMNHKNYISTILVFILTLITNFPIGAARYWAGIMYLGIFILYFKNIFIKFRLIELISIGGMLIIFPLINIFRYITLENFELSSLKVNVLNNFSMLTSGDFDAYSMFLRTLMVVSNKGSVCFSQLMGSIFFFIPRSIWNSKPEISGSYIASELGMTYKNLSEPIFAEGYLNFGIIGFIIFACTLGFILGYIDSNYWKNNKENNFKFILIIYPFLLGNLFTNCRGSLMTTWAYTFGHLSAFFLVYKIYSKYINFKWRDKSEYKI